MITRKADRVTGLRENMRGGNGTVKLTPCCAELPDNARLFSEIVLEPGVSIGYHVHENETELFYFIKGSGRVNDDGQFYDVCAGDSMMTANGHGHGVENTGDTNLVIVAVIIKD